MIHHYTTLERKTALLPSSNDLEKFFKKIYIFQGTKEDMLSEQMVFK